MIEKKGNVILAPGPLHLFWTTGVYYLWELSKSYRVILIVNINYAKDPDFKKVIKLPGVTEVFYIPDHCIIKRHLYYAYEFKRIIMKYRPICILHHDAVYISMMYLYHWDKKFVPFSLMISYLTGLCPIDWKNNHKAIVAYNIDLIANKYGLPKWFSIFMFEIRSFLLLVINYYILPILFIGKYFSPLMNVFSKKILKHYWNDNFNFFLLYDSTDRKVMGQYCGSEDGFKEIQHPLKTYGGELNRVLYGVEEANIVLILPTYGNINYYKKENKMSDEDTIKIISSKWLNAINVMKNKFPDFKFFWKLHPVQEQDFLWQVITDKVKQSTEINMIQPSENAQKWILKSKVIVSENSSVLWWSSLLGTKIAISLDIFNMPFTDDFKYRKGIYYFKDLRDFSATDFNKSNKNILKTSKSIPKLSDFLEEVSVSE